MQGFQEHRREMALKSKLTGDIGGEDGTGLNTRCQCRNVPQAQSYSLLGVLVQQLRGPEAPPSPLR